MTDGTTRQWVGLRDAGAMISNGGTALEVAGAESSSDLAGGQTRHAHDVATAHWVGRQAAVVRGRVV